MLARRAPRRAARAAAERSVPCLVVDIFHDLAHQVEPGGEDPGYNSRGRVPDGDGTVHERQAATSATATFPSTPRRLSTGEYSTSTAKAARPTSTAAPLTSAGTEPGHRAAGDAQVGRARVTRPAASGRCPPAVHAVGGWSKCR